MTIDDFALLLGAVGAHSGIVFPDGSVQIIRKHEAVRLDSETARQLIMVDKAHKVARMGK